jgi:arylsulfatase A-like enzyme
MKLWQLLAVWAVIVILPAQAED